MSKYIIEFKTTKATAVVEYNEYGWLINYQFNPGAFDEIVYIKYVKIFPIHLSNISVLKRTPNVTVKEVPPDVSFDSFWTEYSHKFGNKPRCIKLWGAMPDTEKIKAKLFIAKYNTHLAMTGKEKKLPETYLNQQPWNN